MLEMEEVKKVRREREYYWAGLIDVIGDEWQNPANYDRQMWESEIVLADKKFEELAGQIKLAEMGIVLPDEPAGQSANQPPRSWAGSKRTRKQKSKKPARSC